jgi:hypothetical protein
MNNKVRQLNSYLEALNGPENSGFDVPPVTPEDIQHDKVADEWTIKHNNRKFPSKEAAVQYIAQVLDVTPEELIPRETLDYIIYGIKHFAADVAKIGSHHGSSPFTVFWNDTPKRIREISSRRKAEELPGQSDQPLQEETEKETDVPHETSPNEDEVKKEDSVEVTTVSATVSVNTPKKNSAVYGDKKEFVIYKDDNSKAPAPVPREMGAKHAPAKDFKVNKVKMDTEEPVPREMGVKEAPLKYLEDYKSSIGNILKAIKEEHKI